jgi:hypothetical protein
LGIGYCVLFIVITGETAFSPAFQQPIANDQYPMDRSIRKKAAINLSTDCRFFSMLAENSA